MQAEEKKPAPSHTKIRRKARSLLVLMFHALQTKSAGNSFETDWETRLEKSRVYKDSYPWTLRQSNLFLKQNQAKYIHKTTPMQIMM